MSAYYSEDHGMFDSLSFKLSLEYILPSTGIRFTYHMTPFQTCDTSTMFANVRATTPDESGY